MYKWHVNSAIGRGRPVAHDLARVADGIAASLRQFSISAQRCAEEDGPLPSSRTQRSATAIKEVSNLAPPAPPSKGIDARSLAAKPPSQGFTIRRVDSPVFDDGRGQPSNSIRPRSSSPPRTPFRDSSSGQPGGQPGGFRGGARGGMGMRGGAFRGRGGRGGRGGPRGLRGRNAQDRRVKRPKFAEEADLEILPYSDEELPEYNAIVGGLPEPYNPTTSRASLAGWGPSVITSPQGLKEMVDAKLGVAVDKKYPGWNALKWHKKNMASGGMTVFKDKEERQAVRDWKKGKLGEYTELSEAQKQKLSEQWIGGRYEGPVAVDRKDVLGQVKRYATANGTFLAEDTKQFEQDVAALLPKAKSIPVRKSS